MMKYVSLSLITIAALLVGCAQNANNPYTYSSTQTMQVATVYEGTIVDIKPVRVEGTSTMGTLVGAGVGGVGTALAVGGSDRGLYAVAGALAGALIGNQVEKNSTQQNAEAITVKTTANQMMSVVQAPTGLRVGDRVFLHVNADGTARITR